MARLSHRFLVLAACVALIALLNGCVSSVNEDYAVSGSKQEFALRNKPVTQSFVAAERNLDAIQVMIRIKSSGDRQVPARLGFTLVDVRAREVVSRSVKTVALTAQPQPLRFVFPAQPGSRGRAYEFALTDTRVHSTTNKQLLILASTRNPYPKGRAAGRGIIGANYDLRFRTEIAISAGNALHSFAGRLLADRPFLTVYSILILALILRLLAGRRSDKTGQTATRNTRS